MTIPSRCNWCPIKSLTENLQPGGFSGVTKCWSHHRNPIPDYSLHSEINPVSIISPVPLTPRPGHSSISCVYASLYSELLL